MTTKTDELKPCPFCGGKASFERQGTHRQSCIVVCDSCGCRHESGYEYELSAHGWNTRQPAMHADADTLERFRNPLTPFGLLVRSLRIMANTTLMEMATFTQHTPAQFSAIECGREQLTAETVCFVHRFFHDKGIDVSLYLLQQAADVRRHVEGN